MFENTYRIFPLPYAPNQTPPEWITQSVTSEGLSEHTLRVLLSNASQAEDRTILALGGSLTSSPLADVTTAESVMSYIALHPWIQVVTQNDLMSFPTTSEKTLSSQVPSTPTTLEKDVFSAIQFSPTNEFSTSALDMFLNLTDIDNLDPSYPILQSYLPQIYDLLEASNWVEMRGVRNECQHDLDADGSPECVLSNTEVLLILDPLGGRMEFAAGCKSSGSCSQIIGTTTQLSASLSDPSTWNINHPYNQDLMVIPGALDDQNTIPIRYTISQEPDTISFSNPKTGIVKTYTLVPDGFQVQVTTTNSQSFLIPLIFKADIPYWPNWPLQLVLTQISPNRFSWGIMNKNYLDIDISGAEYEFTSFHQAISTLQQPENPDQAYSDLFFRPFPLAIIQIEPSQEWIAHIRLR